MHVACVYACMLHVYMHAFVVVCSCLSNRSMNVCFGTRIYLWTLTGDRLCAFRFSLVEGEQGQRGTRREALDRHRVKVWKSEVNSITERSV